MIADFEHLYEVANHQLCTSAMESGLWSTIFFLLHFLRRSAQA